MIRFRSFGTTCALLLGFAGTAAAQIAVTQDGERNKALINQKESDNGAEKNRVFTTGNDKNSVTHVQQRGAETDAVSVTQSGDTNSVNAHQRGDSNAITSVQDGERNTAKIKQTATE